MIFQNVRLFKFLIPDFPNLEISDFRNCRKVGIFKKKSKFQLFEIQKFEISEISRFLKFSDLLGNKSKGFQTFRKIKKTCEFLVFGKFYIVVWRPMLWTTLSIAHLSLRQTRAKGRCATDARRIWWYARNVPSGWN